MKDFMNRDKLEKRLDELKQKRTKLFKVKAASPMDIVRLTTQVEKEIEQVKKELEKI
jgi:hypothetical protein